MPIVFHRPITKGFKVKTGTVIPEAEGWHISLTLEDQTVPVTVVEIKPTAENSIGIDLGITNYAYLFNGKRVENPRFLRAYAEKLARLQAKLASRVKGSKPWKILKGKISKHDRLFDQIRAISARLQQIIRSPHIDLKRNSGCIKRQLLNR